LKSFLSKYFGPSTLVTAAFIGPGTVTVCTIAGVQSAFTLLWAIVFSVISTIILQEMAARLGLVTQNGFGEAIRDVINIPILRGVAIILIIGAIVIGNAAYEGGNISGAVLGFEELFFNASTHIAGYEIPYIPIIIGIIAFIVLFTGIIKLIEWFLIILVLLMSLVFLTTAIVVQPDVIAVLKGMFVPTIKEGELLLVMGLVGTTVVPYNLFLHASIVKEKYRNVRELGSLRKENSTAIILGGFISMSIIITSAATLFGEEGIQSATDMAEQLKPLLGAWSGKFLGLGLFAAGISSAITAPLAAAYAAKGILGWKDNTRSWKFRCVWGSILLLGILASIFGGSPIVVIQFAQVANGILLPIVAIFLVYLMNNSKLLGIYTNTVIQNILACIVLAVAIILGFRSLNAVFQFI
jgi:Mn2+/Fe2+ NRAMP family transporter